MKEKKVYLNVYAELRLGRACIERKWNGLKCAYRSCCDNLEENQNQNNLVICIVVLLKI